MKKSSYLLDAFKDLVVDTELNWAKGEIEGQIKSFIKYLIEEKLRPEQRIFENPESRIKSYNSFSEKIWRKGYIQSWQVTHDKDKNKELIMRQLPDLIGFRITCFFLDTERDIYNSLKEYYDNDRFNEIEIDFNENHIQKNGHTIYKVTGKYKKKYSFELQIKSIMHNVWGEVDHKTIYKSRDFDPNIETKRNITEELFNILKASDKQLVLLFEETNTEEKLLQSLFFIKTKDEIFYHIGTDILAEHYDRFFKIFSEKTDRERIKDYIIVALQGKRYKRKRNCLCEVEPLEEELIEEIQNRFYEYDLKSIFYIARIIYPFNSYREFLSYLSRRLLSSCAHDETDEFDTGYDEFDDSATQEDPQSQKINEIITLLSNKIGRVKK